VLTTDVSAVADSGDMNSLNSLIAVPFGSAETLRYWPTTCWARHAADQARR
jgi:hypothetical protein